MILAIYGVLAVLVVLVSIKLSWYVDLLDKKTSLSGAFLGGVMLAAVTSLPELFTSISATVFIHKPELVIGNILGSNLFNLAALALVLLFNLKKMHKATLYRSHFNTLIFTLVIYLMLTVVANGIFNHYFLGLNIVSYAIIIVYLIGIRTMGSDNSQQETVTDNSKLTVRQVLTRFIVASVLLVILSIALTFTTDQIEVKYQLGASLAGALFLGVATSLPELSSTVALVKLRNFNAMFGNILGSNLFNFMILFVADLLYTGGSIYSFSPQSMLLLYFGLASSLVMLLFLFQKSKTDNPGELHRVRLIRGICCLLMVAFYGAFLVLSMA